MSQFPTLKQLRYFVALEQHGHFSQAAAACFVSQAAFSVAIRELETLLGVQLVDRTNRQVTMTPAGRKVAIQARLCLQVLPIRLPPSSLIYLRHTLAPGFQSDSAC